MDEGTTKIEDETELEAVRRQARRVHVRSALAAALVTLLALALPG